MSRLSVFWVAPLSLSLAGLVACGDKEDEDGSGSPAAEACRSLCDQQAAGEECDDDYATVCGDFCILALTDNADCEAAFMGYWECGAEADWTCVDSSGSFNGFPQPYLVDATECASETEAITSACYTGLGDSGR